MASYPFDHSIKFSVSFLPQNEQLYRLCSEVDFSDPEPCRFNNSMLCAGISPHIKARFEQVNNDTGSQIFILNEICT